MKLDVVSNKLKKKQWEIDDEDGVINILDRCPETPAGQPSTKLDVHQQKPTNEASDHLDG